jgi:hypothetical protein
MLDSDKVEKNGKNLDSFLAILLVMIAVTSMIIAITLQHVNAIVSEEVRQTFIKDCSSESGTAPPHLDVSKCPNAKHVINNTPGGEDLTTNDLNLSVNDPRFNTPQKVASPEAQQKFFDACSLESGTAPPHLNMKCPKAIDAFLNRPGAGATNTNSINSNQPTSTSTDNSLGSEITRFNNEANNLKADISSATFTPGNGMVKELINKVAFFGGEVSVMGGGTWTILHGVEDALISKIKESGPSSFSPDEQSYIAAWVNRVMTDRKENPDFSSQILPGFNQ